MDDIVVTLHITSKGKMMDILEKYYMFHKTKLNNQISYELTIKQNIIFDTIVRYDLHGMLPDVCTQSRQQPVSHAFSPLQFTVIQVSTEQHTSGCSPPPPNSTKNQYNATKRSTHPSTRRRTQPIHMKVSKQK